MRAGSAALLCAIALFISAMLTLLWRRFAVARRVLDIPNDRSAHSAPIPRGGGVPIAVTFLACVAGLAARGIVQPALAAALLAGGGTIAAVGFIDDRRSIHPGIRLLTHFAAAALVLACLGGMTPIEIARQSIDLEWVGAVLAALYLVWLLNLYNFMDGIDGMAGLEAVVVCIGIIAAGWQLPMVDRQILPCVLAAATTGFLIWNWPPAKIFMGDAGSGFLGFVMGVLSIWQSRSGGRWLWVWIILLGVFIVDATTTLARRVVRSEPLAVAHSGHCYQRAARRYESHRRVTIAVALINVCWLLPIAVLVAHGALTGLAGVGLGYAPLVWTSAKWSVDRPAPRRPAALPSTGVRPSS